MGMNWAEHTVEIAAPIDTCFAAITDYETFPSWQDAVRSVEVVSRYDDGLGLRRPIRVDGAALPQHRDSGAHQTQPCGPTNHVEHHRQDAAPAS